MHAESVLHPEVTDGVSISKVHSETNDQNLKKGRPRIPIQTRLRNPLFWRTPCDRDHLIYVEKNSFTPIHAQHEIYMTYYRNKCWWLLRPFSRLVYTLSRYHLLRIPRHIGWSLTTRCHSANQEEGSGSSESTKFSPPLPYFQNGKLIRGYNCDRNRTVSTWTDYNRVDTG